MRTRSQELPGRESRRGHMGPTGIQAGPIPEAALGTA
jgi:hypothetical protein